LAHGVQPGPEATLSPAATKLRRLRALPCTNCYEEQAWRAGACRVAGVDEVGRGCLFGPVVAAAVVLDPEHPIDGLRDSKQLTPPRREALAALIRERALGWAVAAVEHGRIDEINIRQATREAMAAAVAKLVPAPDHLLVDWETVPGEWPQTAIVHGDALSVSIAAASIIAKVARDHMICELAPQYPQYDLASNKGYGTRRHLEALRVHGPSLLHRRSFLTRLDLPPQRALDFAAEDDRSDETPVRNETQARDETNE
jgi:ribonuclease HII